MRGMKAICEYEDGRRESVEGLRGCREEMVEAALEGRDPVRIWLAGEEPAWTLETVWVFRSDGKMAKVLLGCYSGEDFWTAMEREVPESWGHVEDEAFETASQVEYRSWDALFRPGEDGRLAAWLQAPCERRLECGATVSADRLEGVATVTWRDDGGECSQRIYLNPGDYERIESGADPVAEGWEDGLGNLVCKDNARAPYAVVETWRNGIMDGRPETVTWHPTEDRAMRDAESKAGYLTPAERARYRVVVVIPALPPFEVMDGKVLWDSSEEGSP